MTDQGRRKLGALVGVCLAGGLLPGITLGTAGADVAFSLAVAFVAVALITQIVHIGPSVRVGAAPLAAFAAAGVLQDSLIWWLLSWLGGTLGAELRVEGFGTIVLAGLITRVSILAVSLLAPSGSTQERTSD
ncbi:hypothetical protein [Streptomyces sp. NPDC086147]|uniref:hypothetical protein n=1 Tax=Streptomyces sp. NPDC086147 TaxID=3155295 RepID=UPI003450F779